MSKFMVTALSCMLALNVFAQHKISGTVRDAKSNNPLAGASVQIENARGTTTDEQGYFELKNVISGKQILSVRFLGYSEGKKEIDVTGDVSVEFVLTESAQLTDEVVVYATRASENNPTAFSNINKMTIQKQNFGQDMPFVLNWTPSLVTTSDAGAGIGYTGVRIRGSDATRINVTINGIVLNDAEEQGVYWVDIPDIATSTQNIQIQRGVGTSTNGAGAFGASINLQTNTRRDQPYADVINSFGSFGTHRHTVGFGTGLKNKFAFDGRMSLIGSDGYIDRATSDLKSYYLSGGYYGNKTMIKAIVFGGKEVTYQSWYGVPQSRLNNDPVAMQATVDAEGWNTRQSQNLFNSGRTFNAYTYPNQIDSYAQDHYQLHFSHQVNDHLTANAALHYTYGRGYYEEYKDSASFSVYGVPNAVIAPGDTVSQSDLIRRLWLDNRFYGTTWSLNYEKEKWSSVLGGAFNKYDGDHYGNIIWAKVALNLTPNYRYYFNNGQKQDFNIYWKNSYKLAEKILAFIDLQYRNVGYHARGQESQPYQLVDLDFSVNYNFFNPKLGLTYMLTPEQQVYGSFSVGNREPVRSDFVQAIGGSQPKHETLNDIEAGWRMRKNNIALNVNGYYMGYKNQLVLTGKLNDVGGSVRTNVPDSYRMGIEIDGGIRFNDKFTWNANLTLSQNKIKRYTETLNNYDNYKDTVFYYKNSNISFSPSIIAGSNLLFHPIKQVEIGLLTKYVGLQYLDNTSNSGRVIDPYFINDIRLVYTLKPTWMRELTLSLLANNIFDVKYSSNGYSYGYIYGGVESRQNYYYPQAGRNYLLMVAMRF